MLVSHLPRRSTAGCCNGPLSGYSVRVGRAKTPLGPFLDQNGVSLNTFSPGGEIPIAANSNWWVGPGGNVVFTDDAGTDYMLYHAVDERSPYFDGYLGFTRRPALLDPIVWSMAGRRSVAVSGLQSVRNLRQLPSRVTLSLINPRRRT